MKGIEEFVFLSVGALAGVFLRYRMLSSPIIVGALPINVLAVNVIGSFILGYLQFCLCFGIWIQNILF
jgi:CrcB protein